LPEGKFKEWLRSYFYNQTNPLYALNKIVSKTEVLRDNSAFIELNDGTMLYGQQSMILPSLKYGNTEKLNKLKGLENYATFLHQLYEQYVKSIYEMEYKLREGDIVVDIGANIGTFSVKAGKVVGKTGKVISIELGGNSLSMLKKNVAVNKLENVEVISKGVWSNQTKQKLYLSNLAWGHCANSIYNESSLGTRDKSKFEEVEVDTLDNILRELNVKKVDFIKMDIEGSEIEALKGMDETLKNKDLKIAGEYHIIKGKSTYNNISLQLRAKGFEICREGGLFYARKK
jgi:FkbM family methyltransferase